MKKLNQKTWLWLGPTFVIIGAALWGTETYFRVYLNTRFDSEVLVFHEHIFCILFTLPLAFLNLNKIRGVPKKAWIYLVLSGVAGSAIGTTFFTLSLKSLNPSVANVLLNFQPLVSILFANLLLNEKPGKRFFAWAAVALGAGLVIAANGFSFSAMQWSVGLLYITITAIAWGFSTVAGRGAMLSIPLPLATAGRFIVGGITMLAGLVINGKFNGEMLKWGQLTEWPVISNFLWLSLVAGVLPIHFYFEGLKKTSASVGGICELTQTFSALVLTWGIMGHALSPTQATAGVVLLAAVYMVNLNYARSNKN